METLKYSQNKLLLRVLGSGAACAGALYLFSNQQIADDLPHAPGHVRRGHRPFHRFAVRHRQLGGVRLARGPRG